MTVSQICYSNQSLDHVRAAFQQPFICLYNTPLKLGYMCVPHIWWCPPLYGSGVSKVNPGSTDRPLLSTRENTFQIFVLSTSTWVVSSSSLLPLSLLYTWSSLTSMIRECVLFIIVYC